MASLLLTDTRIIAEENLFYCSILALFTLRLLIKKKHPKTVEMIEIW